MYQGLSKPHNIFTIGLIESDSLTGANDNNYEYTSPIDSSLSNNGYLLQSGMDSIVEELFQDIIIFQYPNTKQRRIIVKDIHNKYIQRMYDLITNTAESHLEQNIASSCSESSILDKENVFKTIKYLESIDLDGWADQLSEYSECSLFEYVTQQLSFHTISILYSNLDVKSVEVGSIPDHVQSLKSFIELIHKYSKILELLQKNTLNLYDVISNNLLHFIPIKPVELVHPVYTHRNSDIVLQSSDHMRTKRQLRFNGISGHNPIKSELVETILWPCWYPNLFQKIQKLPTTGILLYGPPGNNSIFVFFDTRCFIEVYVNCYDVTYNTVIAGTGKTLFPRVIASELNCYLVNLKLTDVVRGSIGSGEHAVFDAFSLARKNSPSIIFIDEFQVI
jgi:hypothetical protein